MALPVRATLDDVNQTCAYLATKPTGATLKDISGVLGDTLADARRINALETWGLIQAQEDGRYKATEDGRRCAKGDEDKAAVLQAVIHRIPAYLSIIERAAHRREDALTATDVGAHWHDHFKGEVSDSEDQLKMQVISFFQVAEGAGLGTLIIGRRGAPTRFSFDTAALARFVGGAPPIIQAEPAPTPTTTTTPEPTPELETGRTTPHPTPDASTGSVRRTGQGIFIAHGKNKKPLEQLKKILEQFKIPYKVATEEPSLGRPISGKVRDIMESCNCAILVFTADEELKTKGGETTWRPSENVVYELGASGYLYDNRIVIMKEEGVTFPANFRDIGYIAFGKDQLDAKAMDILKELIGFGIVKVST